MVFPNGLAGINYSELRARLQKLRAMGAGGRDAAPRGRTDGVEPDAPAGHAGGGL
jgi:hypothetical protein